MKLLVLDRDGVINFDSGYVCRKEDFQFLDGIFDFCKIARAKGYEIVIATNQAGIARGLYSEKDFHNLTKWMLSVFASNDIQIRDVLYCPHHPDFQSQEKLGCSCRKPQPGMLLRARDMVDCPDYDCIIIGDKDSDLLAGINAHFSVRVGISSLPLKESTHTFRSVRDLADWSVCQWFDPK